MNLTLIKTNSLGEAYFLANEASKQGHRVLEVSPLGAQGHLIVSGKFQISQYLKNGESIKSIYISDCYSEIWDAYMSVSSSNLLNGGLLVCESDFIGDLFEMAKQSITSEVKIIDLRLMRGSGASSYLLLTSESGHALRKVSLSISNKNIKIKLIADVTSELTEFFNI